jgi:hypothetical protein
VIILNKARITFSNGETLIVKEGDVFVPIISIESDDGTYSAMEKSCELWAHIHDGLIPSLTALLYQCRFFFHADNSGVIYSTSSIVKIEII